MVSVDPMTVVLPVVVPLNKLPLAEALKTGNESGFAVGVMVVEPTTISGAEADPAGTAVPVRVAVTVVEEYISVRVTMLPGRAVDDGFVVCELGQ